MFWLYYNKFRIRKQPESIPRKDSESRPIFGSKTIIPKKSGLKTRNPAGSPENSHFPVRKKSFSKHSAPNGPEQPCRHPKIPKKAAEKAGMQAGSE